MALAGPEWAAEVERAVAPLRRDPATTALLFDFDGTLSPTVLDPDAAVLLPGVFERLEALADRYGVVGAISGRPVSFLVEHLPPVLALSGQYGLEIVEHGETVVRPEIERWRAVLADEVARAVAAAPEGVRVETKGLTATIHYRGRPDREADAVALAASVAGAAGLLARPARQSVELVPPGITSKGDEVRRLTVGTTAALFAGDDIGDLPGFEALATRRAEGVSTVAVAVASDELPAELRAAADLLVPSTDDVLVLLDALVG